MIKLKRKMINHMIQLSKIIYDQLYDNFYTGKLAAFEGIAI